MEELLLKLHLLNWQKIYDNRVSAGKRSLSYKAPNSSKGDITWISFFCDEYAGGVAMDRNTAKHVRTGLTYEDLIELIENN